MSQGLLELLRDMLVMKRADSEDDLQAFLGLQEEIKASFLANTTLAGQKAAKRKEQEDLDDKLIKKDVGAGDFITAPDGSKDENVFDIQQGTAIFIGVKTGKKKK